MNKTANGIVYDLRIRTFDGRDKFLIIWHIQKAEIPSRKQNMLSLNSKVHSLAIHQAKPIT